MEEILRDLLQSIVTASSIHEINVAAGIAHQELLAMLDDATTGDTSHEEVLETA